MKNLAFLFAAAAAMIVAACNSDNVILDDRGPLPEVVFDHPDGVYTVKTGRQLTLVPAVEHAGEEGYEWILDDVSVGRELSHTFSFDEPQTHYATFKATNAAGTTSVDLRIEAVAAAPPAISLALASESVQVLPDTDCTFTPVYANSSGDDFRCEWRLDGIVVSTGRSYTFRAGSTGLYLLTVTATNEDGEASHEIRIEVVASLPQSVRFAQQSYLQRSTDRSAIAGRPLYLEPITENFAAPRFEWRVDGIVQEQAADRTFVFTPRHEGEYSVSVSVSDAEGGATCQAAVKVHCAAAAVPREKSASSLRTQSCVFEYTPAPGQFINETQTGGFTSEITTHEAAAAYAAARMDERKFVSLGGFGGYIVVGFDHSVTNRGGSGYDFAIQGNAFLSNAGGSNEPGIVWVMQESNGNGLPDDEWYELRGSESGSEGTIRNYSVTYYRPQAPQMPVQWSDSEGNSGTIDYMKVFHRQDFYYPLWVEAGSYTLCGTRLAPRNTEDSAGNWHNNAFGWGYADNCGEDNMADGDAGGEGQITGFRIDNAMQPDGTPVELDFIDFVKVQTALNTKSGALGENSTEVYSFTDLSME